MSYLKQGMPGSNGGKSRTDRNETLKRNSKKRRRRESLKELAAGLGMTVVRGALGGRYIE